MKHFKIRCLTSLHIRHFLLDENINSAFGMKITKAEIISLRATTSYANIRTYIQTHALLCVKIWFSLHKVIQSHFAWQANG